MNDHRRETSGSYPAAFIENPWGLLKRYMPVIGVDALVGCLSIGLTAILAMLTYLSQSSIEFSVRTSLLSCMGLGALFALAKYEVLYGRIHWVWVNVAIYLACLLVALPSIAYRPNAYLYSLCLLSPLIGLLILNSNRCRELRHKMVEIRHKREAIIATLKKQGRWKWW